MKFGTTMTEEEKAALNKMEEKEAKHHSKQEINTFKQAWDKLYNVHNFFMMDYQRQQIDVDESERQVFKAPKKSDFSTVFWAANRLKRAKKFEPLYSEFEKASPFYQAAAYPGNFAAFGKMIYKTDMVKEALAGKALTHYTGYVKFIHGLFFGQRASAAADQLRAVLTAAKVTPQEFEAIFYQYLAASFEPIVIDGIIMDTYIDRQDKPLNGEYGLQVLFKYESAKLRERRLPQGARLNRRQRKEVYDNVIYWTGLWLFIYLSEIRQDIIQAYTEYGHTYSTAAALAWGMVNPYGKTLDTKGVYLPAPVKSHKYMIDNAADGMIKAVFDIHSDGQTSLFPFANSYDHSTGQEYTSTIALYWQGDKSVKIGRNLTAPDRSAFNAICTLQNADYKVMTIKDIYCATHDVKDTSRKIRQAQLDKLVKSIKKMLSTWVVLDFSEEARATGLKIDGQDVKDGVIEGMLLKADLVDITLKNGSKVQGLRMASPELPTLYQYCEAKAHILTLPRALMDTTSCLNETDRLPGIKEYLAQRISGYSTGALNQNKIKYSTIYNYLGEEYPASRVALARDKETFSKIMAILTLRDHIKGYHMDTESMEFYLEKDFNTTPPKGMTDKNSKKEYVAKRTKENEHLRKRITKELNAAFTPERQAAIKKEWQLDNKA